MSKKNLSTLHLWKYNWTNIRIETYCIFDHLTNKLKLDGVEASQSECITILFKIKVQPNLQIRVKISNFGISPWLIRVCPTKLFVLQQNILETILALLEEQVNTVDIWPLLKAIQSWSNQGESCVCILGTKSDTFPVCFGLCQGFPLSLILFIWWERISGHSLGMEESHLCFLQMMWFCWCLQLRTFNRHWGVWVSSGWQKEISLQGGSIRFYR